jgi:hypothetical protein
MEYKLFFEDMGLLIVKNHLPIQSIENMWMKCSCLHLCPRLGFPFKKQFSREISLELVEKTKQLYVLPILAKHNSTITSFDLWLSKGAHDIFVFVINILGIGL